MPKSLQNMAPWCLPDFFTRLPLPSLPQSTSPIPPLTGLLLVLQHIDYTPISRILLLLFPLLELSCSAPQSCMVESLTFTALFTMKLVKLPCVTWNQTIQIPVHLWYSLSHTIQQFFSTAIISRQTTYLLICSFSEEQFLHPVTQQDVSFMSTRILVTGVSYTRN